MAISVQQQLRQRKLIYLGLILALFTVSLLHRRFVVEAAADQLQLRETSRGEVDLPSSAVRLILTGSRGLAVTFLWSSAVDMQERHEWNELDLLVTSITRLQPYFVTPWLFQSWNLAFNVAVEFDRPSEKYVYVNRGLQLLAKGERVHQGGVEEPGSARKQRFPGNPDMRHYMGVTYLRKIGGSDEKNTMQCLLDMSCIDPLRLERKNLTKPGPRGDTVVDLVKLAEFARNYPRLVRRLHDKLDYTTPEQVVAFLVDHPDLPSRFVKGDPELGESPLKDWKEQCPALPPALEEDWPNPKLRDLSQRESADVFLIARSWFSYSQRDLPPPNTEGGTIDARFDPLKHRIPKNMSIFVFRSYPPRTQAYHAEGLQEEGWFDGDGWSLRDWFERDGPGEEDRRVGIEPKYHSAIAWEKAYRMYLNYGIENGVYLTPGQRRDLDEKAQLYRKAYKVHEFGSGPDLRGEDRQGPLAESYKAHMRLYWFNYIKGVTNFPDFLAQTDGERASATVLARKLTLQAQHLYRTGQDPESALALYQRSWDLWLDTMLQHVPFAGQSHVQEELYEVELRYLFRLLQKQRAPELQKILSGFAQMAAWPNPPYFDRLPQTQKDRILPVRTTYGPLDSVFLYDGPNAQELKEALLLWSQGASYPLRMIYPGQVQRQLTGQAFRDQILPRNWRFLLNDDTLTMVRVRLGLMELPTPPGQPPPPGGLPPGGPPTGLPGQIPMK